MSVGINQRERLTARKCRMLVRPDCASGAAAIELVAERMVEAAGLRVGDAVPDVATGTGNAAITATRCGWLVSGVDDVEAPLDRGRDRVAAAVAGGASASSDGERCSPFWTEATPPVARLALSPSPLAPLELAASMEVPHRKARRTNGRSSWSAIRLSLRARNGTRHGVAIPSEYVAVMAAVR